MSDQSRASGHCVTRWAEALRPEVILVENVREFLEWGPSGQRPAPMLHGNDERGPGVPLKAFPNALQGLGRQGPLALRNRRQDHIDGSGGDDRAAFDWQPDAQEIESPNAPRSAAEGRP